MLGRNSYWKYLFFGGMCMCMWASQIFQWQRIHLPMHEIQGTWVWFLGQEDPLKEEMTTHSSILAWEIPWTEKPGELQSMMLQTVRCDWVTKQHSMYVCMYMCLGCVSCTLYSFKVAFSLLIIAMFRQHNTYKLFHCSPKLFHNYPLG